MPPVRRVIKLKAERLCTTRSTLGLAVTKGSRRPYILLEDTHTPHHVRRAIGVPQTACKYEFRKKILDLTAVACYQLLITRA